MKKIELLLLSFLSFISVIKGGESEIFFSLEKQTTSYELPFVYNSYVERYRIKEGKLSNSLNSSPSVFIKENSKDYGVSLISIRGFSSNQTSVVYDGFKLPKDLTRTYDISVLPPAYYSDLYLLKGGWSAVYGSDSEGGVIAIKTQDLKPDTQIAVLDMEYGSYNAER